MAYKDKDKQREAVKAATRRYRANKGDSALSGSKQVSQNARGLPVVDEVSDTLPVIPSKGSTTNASLPIRTEDISSEWLAEQTAMKPKRDKAKQKALLSEGVTDKALLKDERLTETECLQSHVGINPKTTVLANIMYETLRKEGGGLIKDEDPQRGGVG